MYSAKILDTIQYRPGAWTGLRVGVFRNEGDSEEQVGEYERNYPNLFRTFYPFQSSGKDYALYSQDYTATRIMELPSCKDIGGEEPSAAGFCPVDFYVPCYIEREYVDIDDKTHRYRVNEPKEEEFLRRTNQYTPVDEMTGKRCRETKLSCYITNLSFLWFRCWLHLGGDSSWKIQYLDLSHAAQGVIKRDERFGYIALPDKLTLKDAIDIDYLHDPEEEWAYQITIAVQKKFDLRTCKLVEVDPFG